ncbi:hypothetical protein AB4865_02255 [Capnocytophaga sp. ARDL2]|uniref:hypothetical protein n=1 Tax=Capnocytophaga sp. ARDL2 TaxID=3238809 RepID=UPI00355857B1
MKKILFLLVACIGMVACNNDDTNHETKVDYETLAKDNYRQGSELISSKKISTNEEFDALK